MSATLAAEPNPRVVITIVGASALLVSAAWLATGHALSVLAACICMVAFFPIALRREYFDVFAPWNYLFYFVLLNVLLRSLLLDFDVGSTRSTLMPCTTSISHPIF